MYKSDAEVERILDHPKNVTRISIIGPGNHGKNGAKKGEAQRGEISKDDKARIGTLARLIGSKATGEIIDMSPSQVSRYKQGENSYAHPDAEIEAKIQDNLAPIRNKAIANVDFLLDIVRDKASKMPASKAAGAAKNLVEVYEKLGPKNPALTLNTPQVVFIAPRVLESSDYPTIEVETVHG